jgi:3,4-dihydroxy 2-butanone 4-phosphate synthase
MEQLETLGGELAAGLQALREGAFVLLHDSVGREDEVDMVTAGELVSPEHIRAMRNDAGGLVCLALGYDVGEKLGIVSMHDILLVAARRYPILRLLHEETAPYGGKSAFSITVNHRDTFTGVTDRDRSLTIREMSKLCKPNADYGKDCREILASQFRTPGHVHLLLESRGSLAERRGHTELSVYLCRLAGMAPAAVICEMLDGNTHNALSVEQARSYARTHSIPFLEGQQLVRNFSQQDTRWADARP